ncbi:MAG: hypothetical protein GY859_30155, partial [Desulfobacterales bacterium]|nr:hypothetical protein [Desulfobacterales bacterium]
LNANLDGDGAIAQGRGAAAVGKRGVYITGDVNRGFIVTGDANTINLFAAGDPGDRRRRYLAELAAAADNLPWASVDPEFADPGRGDGPGLTDIYTALDTTELERVESEDQVRDYLGRQAAMERVSAQKMINTHEKLVLLGDPGSGKSTLVNFLTYIMANAGRDEKPDAWLERLRQTGPWDHGVPLPVRIILRDLAAELDRAGGAPVENPLLVHLQNAFHASGAADFWPDFHEGLLDPETSYLILLDGLDEAPASSRQAVTRAIDDFARKYSGHRYLVTCRIHAYVDRSHQLRGFRRATLTPFSEDQINGFISAWYRDLSIRGRFTKKEAEERADKLKRAATRPDLIGLAGRPLLL